MVDVKEATVDAQTNIIRLIAGALFLASDQQLEGVIQRASGKRHTTTEVWTLVNEQGLVLWVMAMGVSGKLGRVGVC